MTKSLYADRDTLGTTALKAARSGIRAEVGEMSSEIMKSFVEDLNNTIQSRPYGDKAFYISVHEKKDLLLKNVLMRRMVVSERRPYPEPATTVFWTNPKTQETRFCWSLPHTSHFPNILANPEKYGEEQIADIKAWKSEKMEHFGFKKIGETEGKVPLYMQDEAFKDRPLRKGPRK